MTSEAPSTRYQGTWGRRPDRIYQPVRVQHRVPAQIRPAAPLIPPRRRGRARRPGL